MELMIEALTGRAGGAETRKRNAINYRMQTLFGECILKLDCETYCLAEGVLKFGVKTEWKK